MDNQAALAYIRKMWGTVNQKMNQVSKELWEFLIGHNYCRISPRKAQYSSGQGISRKGQQKMKIKSKDISETVLCKGWSRNRCVSHQSNNSHLTVLLLENRPLESGNGCISIKLEESKGICFSPLFPNGASSEKNSKRASKLSFNCTGMAVTSMVSMPVADVHKKSNFVAKKAKRFKKYSRGKFLISPKELYVVGGMDSIREKLLAEGISKESAELELNLTMGNMFHKGKLLP